MHANGWLTLGVVFAACGGSAVIDEGTTSGGGGSSTNIASSTGASMAQRCGMLGEAACDAASECLSLFDWLDVVDGSPPPPPDTPASGPCCPECMAERCRNCHVPTFTACVPLSECGAPPPDGTCGFPSDDCP